jgi:predicted O-methyltransferase YrrM
MRPFVEHYDRIFADKNYDKDVRDFVDLVGAERLKSARLLEIGSGTGQQTIRLADKVDTLLAVEIDPDFWNCLQLRLASAGLPNVHASSLRIEELTQSECADCAAAFFHVLNYLDRRALVSFVDALCRLMKPGAVFVADLWHAEAALADPPRVERRSKQFEGTTTVVDISPQLDTQHLSVKLDYAVSIEMSGRLVQFTETLSLWLHRLPDLTRILHQAGFEDIEFWDYRRYPERVSNQSWRLWLRCRKGNAALSKPDRTTVS